MRKSTFPSTCRSVASSVWIALFLLSQVSIPVHAKQPELQMNVSVPYGPIGSCSLFPSNNIWNTPVDTLPIHARSAQWVSSIGSTTGFHMDFGSGTWDSGPIGIPYNVVGSGVTKVPVSFYYPDESDVGPYPIPASPLREYGSDHHILIVDTSTCTLYELYDASYSNGSWQAGSGAIWDLNSNALRPDTWTSADAAGLPILPGLVRYDEILSGSIDHAIRFTASDTNGYIWPARHLTSNDPSAPEIPPMGARFRLKASYDLSRYPPEMQVILQAMKTYGIILADNGSNWYISGAPDERWNNDMLHLLDDLTGSDFEAVDISSLMVDSDSGATGSTISGNAGAAGVTLSYTDGIVRMVTSQPNGDYSLRVTNNWSGTITPSHPCFDFDPASRTYDPVTSNQINQNFAITPSGELCVSSITRASNNPTNASTVLFTVTFTAPVSGVDAGDFVLTKTGVTGTSIASVSGSQAVYNVTVNTGSGNGTIRLDLKDDDSILGGSSNPLGGDGSGNGDFISGEEYSIVKSAPIPGVPSLLSPASGVLLGNVRPVLDWKDSVPAAHHYQLQIATNGTFTSLVTNETNILDSTFTSASDLSAGKLYYWRVKAFNVIGGASSWSTVRSFKTPLALPTLTSPANAASLLTDRPTLTWAPVNGAGQYVLQVAASNTFGTLLVNTVVNTTNYTMAKDLPQNKTLYWRVAAKTSVVMSPWSAKWSFVTGNPPGVPVLASPANGALLRDYTPLFNWNNSTIPLGTTFKQYELQVDDNSDFSSLIINATTTLNDITDSDFTPADLNPLASNTKYYWRVRAVNTISAEDHVSGWSTTWSFRTVIPAPIGLIVIANDTHPLRPIFDWADATGTISSYTIQISTSSTFGTLLVNSTAPTSTYTPLNNLPSGRTLYWRARVNGANGPSGWSTASFTLP